MKRKGSLDRAPRTKKENKRILVVTEGMLTEKQYIELLRQHLRKAGVKCLPVTPKGIGSDPVAVVKAGIDKRSRDLGSLDSVWAIVDVDEHAHLQEAILLAAESNINLVINNPCFELWLLWHIKDHRKNSSGKSVQQILALNGFKGKSLPANFPIHEYEAACSRASVSCPDVKVNEKSANPSSSMALLIDYILKN